MPIVTLEGPVITDPAVKQTIAEELTAAAAKAYGMPKEMIIVLIRENRPDQVAVGGKLLG